MSTPNGPSQQDWQPQGWQQQQPQFTMPPPIPPHLRMQPPARRTPVGAIVSLLGAIGIIVGTLLPWISAGFMSYTPPLFSSDAGLFFVLGVIVAVVALVWLLGNAGGLRWLCVALGLLGLALAIFEMVRLTSTAPEMVSLGVGLILCAVGGAVAAVGGAIR